MIAHVWGPRVEMTSALIMSVVLWTLTALAGPKDEAPPLPRVVIERPASSSNWDRSILEVRALSLQWVAPNRLEISGRVTNISAQKPIVAVAVRVSVILFDKDGDTLAVKKELQRIDADLLLPGMTTKFRGVFEVDPGTYSFMPGFNEIVHGDRIPTRFDDALIRELNAIIK